MESAIREAGGCTDFVAIITYPDTTTQIPNHYRYTYTLKGNVITEEFDNVNPDEVNETLNENTSNGNVRIIELNKKDEFVVIKNVGDTTINISGWKIRSVKGNQFFTFPDYTLNPKIMVKIGDSSTNSDVDFHWLDGKGIWNNSNSDPAELYNNVGELVDRYND